MRESRRLQARAKRSRMSDLISDEVKLQERYFDETRSRLSAYAMLIRLPT
jgi:hypothetical protein